MRNINEFTQKLPSEEHQSLTLARCFMHKTKVLHVTLSKRPRKRPRKHPRKHREDSQQLTNI